MFLCCNSVDAVEPEATRVSTLLPTSQGPDKFDLQQETFPVEPRRNSNNYLDAKRPVATITSSRVVVTESPAAILQQEQKEVPVPSSPVKEREKKKRSKKGACCSFSINEKFNSYELVLYKDSSSCTSDVSSLLTLTETCKKLEEQSRDIESLRVDMRGSSGTSAILSESQWEQLSIALKTFKKLYNLWFYNYTDDKNTAKFLSIVPKNVLQTLIIESGVSGSGSMVRITRSLAELSGTPALGSLYLRRVNLSGSDCKGLASVLKQTDALDSLRLVHCQLQSLSDWLIVRDGMERNLPWNLFRLTGTVCMDYTLPDQSTPEAADKFVKSFEHYRKTQMDQSKSDDPHAAFRDAAAYDMNQRIHLRKAGQ